jgi:hypothetical protein
MSIADWTNFFIAEVGASAALAGLVVVAISINLTRILSFPQLPARAAESLVVVSFGLMPGLSMYIFGAAVLVFGLVILMVTLNRQLKVRVAGPVEGLTPFKKYLHAAVSTAVTLPLIVGGALLLLGFSGGFYWAAAGVLISLAAGVWSAWILLIEIVR